MLQAILNKFWRQHSTKQQLYGHWPPITKTIKIRWTRHVGHCWRSSDVLLWTPSHGRAMAGCPAGTYMQQLCANMVLYFDLRPGPKILFQGDTPEGSDTFQWPVIERDCVGGLRLMIWDKVKVPLCHYSDAPEESNLWTAWQLFPLDDN